MDSPVTMNLFFRGLCFISLECNGTETFAELKDRVAQLDNLKPSDLTFHIYGDIISDHTLAKEHAGCVIQYFDRCLGGDRHGTLPLFVEKTTPDDVVIPYEQKEEAKEKSEYLLPKIKKRPMKRAHKFRNPRLARAYELLKSLPY